MSAEASFGGFSFPVSEVPGASAGGVPLGMMYPLSPVTTSADSGTGDTSASRKNEPGSPEGKKQKKQQDRRERAKLHARKFREKKKHELEDLEEEEKMLREENLRLRALVRTKLPDQAQHIVSKCCYSSERVRHLNPYIFQQGVHVGENGGEEEPPTSPPAQLGGNDFDLIESLSAGKQSFVLTDPRLPDNPIVYCSDSFCELTGYSRDLVLGRNCRFLQAPETDPAAVQLVREAVKSGSDCTTVMLNVKADGTTFWNRIFVAPLRDCRGRIVNYVGVQTEAETPPESGGCMGMDIVEDEKVGSTNKQIKQLDIKRIPDSSTRTNIETDVEPVPFFGGPDSPVGDGEEDLNDEELGDIDWVGLAESLEKDYSEASEECSRSPKGWGSSWISKLAGNSGGGENACDNQDAAMSTSRFVKLPRLFTTNVVRSEVVNALLSSYGDVTDSRFDAALDVLSSFYKSTRIDVSNRDRYHDLMNGSWRSLSRPAFQGCMGMKSDGSFVYELGTMSFGMFGPASIQCAIQNTLTHISPATTPSDGSQTIAPWSLRRELAVLNDGKEVPNGSISGQNYSMLKTYDIAMSLRVEPAKDSECSSGPIQAVKQVKGYMLPDPSVPNRLTIWFVGGKLSPIGPEGAKPDEATAPSEWKELFGGSQDKTWKDSIKDAGAKLFLGAELPHGMAADGTLSYQLHRPHGGHGVAYIDVLYYDEHLLVTRGNRGTIYVASRQDHASAVPAVPHSTAADFPLKVGSLSPLETKKRKVSDLGDDVASTISEQGNEKRLCSIKNLPPTVSPMSSSLADAVSGAKRRNISGINHRPKAISPAVSRPKAVSPTGFPLPETQTHDVGGVKNILHSVEAFFSWGN